MLVTTQSEYGDFALKIIGAGGLARELYCELISAKKHNFTSIEFISKNISDLEPYPELRAKWVEEQEFTQINDESIFLVAIGDSETRKNLMNRLISLEKSIYTFTSPRSYLSDMSTSGKGSMILAGVTVSGFSNVGNGVLVNPGTTIAHDVKIGDYTSLGPGVRLCGNVSIGEETSLGAGCVVLPGISVGNNSIVGAGAVVTKNVGDFEVVAGVPAVKLRSLKED